MKFNKKEKDIIRKIVSGEIQDLYSYMGALKLLTFAQFKKSEIEHSFFIDPLPKKYYFPLGLSPKFSTIVTPDTFTQKVDAGLINPDQYTSFPLSLNFSHGIKHLSWNNVDYEIDFYDGVNIATSFDDIISFLSLWQYLKSEMLIVELPSNLTAQTLGLFYEKQTMPVPINPLSEAEKISNINFANHTYDDNQYCNRIDYKFSIEKCTICKDYLDKKIYPTPKLNLYIQRNFKTTEERTQSSALLAAWLAIGVSITLSLLPFFQSNESKYLSQIVAEINHIEDELITIKEQLNIYSSETNDQLDKTNQKIEKITEFLDTLNINNE